MERFCRQPKKILITAVSAGAGHVRAAAALTAAFREKYPRIETNTIDIMDFVSAPFRNAYIKDYLLLVNKFPAAWDLLYRVTDKPGKAGRLNPLLSCLQRINAGKFFAFLKQAAPDCLVSTHFILPQLVSGKTRVPVNIVVTDYDLHQVWFHQAVDRYFVANRLIAGKLENMGVNPAAITISGIPIDPVFCKKTDTGAVYRDLDLSPRLPTLLLLSGGHGVGNLDQTIAQLTAALTAKLQIISVSGNNKDLHARIAALPLPATITLRNLGFVKNMHELMSVARVVITKPGGLTVSECLASGLPMIMVSPIPGQEERNADYVMEHGAGVKALSTVELIYKVSDVLSNPAKLVAMKKNALALAKPDAADIIATAIAANEGE